MCQWGAIERLSLPTKVALTTSIVERKTKPNAYKSFYKRLKTKGHAKMDKFIANFSNHHLTTIVMQN